MMCRRLMGIVVVLIALALTSCGGSSGSNVPVPNPAPTPTVPAGDFQLVLPPSPAINIQQGGAFEFEVVEADPINGFKGTITLTFTGLPTGVTTSGVLAIAITGRAQNTGVQLAASQNSPLGTSTVTVTGTSGNISHTATFPLTIRQAAPFAIQVSPSSVSLSPGSDATVQLTVTSDPGTSPELSVSVFGVPGNSQVRAGLPLGLVSPANPASFRIEATALAQPLQNVPLLYIASDNANNTAMITLPLTVMVPFTSNATPTRSTFVRTDQSPTGIVYDRLRKLLFVSVEILNEVVVLSSTDGRQVASIPVRFPGGIDLAADESAVYVASPLVGGVTIIDPNLLQVTGHSDVPTSVSGITLPVTFFQVAALSNGKVLFYPTFDMVDLTKPPFYLWDPTTDTFSRFGPQSLALFVAFISRSADHSKVLAYGGSTQGFLYDVTTDMFVGPSTVFNGFPAISPDGTQIASGQFQVSPPELAFYDSSLNQVASLPFDALSFGGSSNKLFYSPDGKRLYVVPDEGFGTAASNEIVTVIDTTSFTVIGVIPAPSFGVSLPFGGQQITTFSLDETGMLFGATFGGVGFLDLSEPTFLQQPLPSNKFSVQPNLANLLSLTPVQVNGVGFSQGMNVFFGAPPTSPQTVNASNVSVQSTNLMTLTLPAGMTAGPANATLTRSDGFFDVVPDAVTFGPTILQVDGDAGSQAGGDAITVVGYGVSGPNTQVFIGGRQATITQKISTPHGQRMFPTEEIGVTTPPGASGKVDLTVNTPSGSATVSGGFQYLNSVQAHPLLGVLDALIYDRVRQRLYISNQDHNRVEIFDLAANSFLAPVPVGNSPTALTLTPDSSELAVLNRGDNTVSVIDPAKLTVTSTFSLLTTADTDPVGCGGVVLNITSAQPHRVVADIDCTVFLFNGRFHLANLDTGSLDCTGVAGCSANGTDINFGNGLAGLASSSDGSKILLASTAGGGSAIPLGVLDLTANTLTKGFPCDCSDAAISDDGTVMAANFAMLNAQGNLVGLMAFEPYADSGAQSNHNVAGEKLNSSGSLLFYPQDSGVDIFDVHTGRLVHRIVLPATIPHNSGAMALDETGTKMFLTATTGIVVAQLDPAPLSVATVIPSAGPAATPVVIRGSGFQNGAVVLFGTTQVSSTFVDASTLQATVPTLPSGPIRVSIRNPGGQQYSLDDAYKVQ